MKRRLLAGYLGVAVLVLVLLEVPLAISYARAERQALTDKVERAAVALASLVEDSLERGSPVPAQVRRIARDYERTAVSHMHLAVMKNIVASGPARSGRLSAFVGS